MAKLIVVCGLSASGKTTLARELSKQLNMVCLHKDFIKENLCEILDCKSLEDSKTIGAHAFKLFFALAGELVASKNDIIIEAPFYFDEDRARLADWQEKYAVDVYSVICSMDDKEREKRFQDRFNTTRHWSHFDHQRMNDPDRECDYSGMPGKQIQVVTNKPVEELANNLIGEFNL